MLACRIPLDRPLDLALTLGPVQRGPRDPSLRLSARECWRAAQTPDGPATTHLAHTGDAVEVRAWGAGAAWALDALPALLGLGDRSGGFQPRHAVVAELHRRMPGLRLGRTGGVVEALVPTILEQKVTSVEAHVAYRRLVRRFGEPAPGPAGARGLSVPPEAARLAALPYFAYHPLGVGRRRADVVRRVCARATRLDALARDAAPGHVDRVLRAFPGVGAWTAAEVRAVALGDPDAVSVGDFHLPSLVARALAGEPRGDDARMLELLEPYRGQRARVIRLLEAGCSPPPRRAPRAPLRTIAAI